MALKAISAFCLLPSAFVSCAALFEVDRSAFKSRVS